MVNGIRTASAAETLLALARSLHLLDLIVLADSALHFGDCTIEQLSSTAAQRRRGAPRLRMAIPLLDRRGADLTRERRLVEMNVQRVGFTSPQLLHEGGSIIAGLDRLLGRTWDPRRLALWEALLNHSLLRPSRRAEAIDRWRRSV